MGGGLPLAARLQRGAAIDVRERATQTEVFENQLFARIAQPPLSPAGLGPDRNADFDTTLFDDQNTLAIWMALIDFTLALYRLPVARRYTTSAAR